MCGWEAGHSLTDTVLEMFPNCEVLNRWSGRRAAEERKGTVIMSYVDKLFLSERANRESMILKFFLSFVNLFYLSSIIIYLSIYHPSNLCITYLLSIIYLTIYHLFTYVYLSVFHLQMSVSFSLFSLVPIYFTLHFFLYISLMQHIC